MKIALNQRQMINLALYNIGEKKLEKNHPLYSVYKNLKLDGRYDSGRNEIEKIAEENVSNFKEYNFKYFDAADIAFEISINAEYEIMDMIGDLFDDIGEDRFFILVEDKYYFGQHWGDLVGPIKDLSECIIGFSVSVNMYIFDETKKRLLYSKYHKKFKKLEKIINDNFNCPVELRIFIGSKDWNEYEKDGTIDNFIKRYLKNDKYKNEFYKKTIKYKPNILTRGKNLILCLSKILFWGLMEIDVLYNIYTRCRDYKYKKQVRK